MYVTFRYVIPIFYFVHQLQAGICPAAARAAPARAARPATPLELEVGVAIQEHVLPLRRWKWSAGRWSLVRRHGGWLVPVRIDASLGDRGEVGSLRVGRATDALDLHALVGHFVSHRLSALRWGGGSVSGLYVFIVDIPCAARGCSRRRGSLAWDIGPVNLEWCWHRKRAAAVVALVPGCSCRHVFAIVDDPRIMLVAAESAWRVRRKLTRRYCYICCRCRHSSADLPPAVAVEAPPCRQRLYHCL